jgi:hypothetical protein
MVLASSNPYFKQAMQQYLQPSFAAFSEIHS